MEAQPATANVPSPPQNLTQAQMEGEEEVDDIPT